MSIQKILIITFCFFAQATANAADFVLPDDGIALKPIEGTLSSVQMLRAPGCTRCLPEAIARINFTIGCGNTLGPVTYKASRARDGKVDLLVSALEVIGQGTANLRCVRAPVSSVQIGLGGAFTDQNMVRIQFIKLPATTSEAN
jgi:hypothetical protein